MIPKASEGIGHLAGRILADLVPKAGEAYAAADLAYISVLLSLVGQDYDRAADVLVSEHAVITGLLAEARGALPGLSARIDAALAVRAQSLRIPELNARADATLAALIEVHAAVEQAMAEGAAWAEDLDRKIWAYYEQFGANRAYDAPL